MRGRLHTVTVLTSTAALSTATALDTAEAPATRNA